MTTDDEIRRRLEVEDDAYQRRLLEAQYRKVRAYEVEGIVFPTPQEDSPVERASIVEAFGALAALEQRLRDDFIAQVGKGVAPAEVLVEPTDVELARAVHLIGTRHTSDEQEVVNLLQIFEVQNLAKEQGDGHRGPMPTARDQVYVSGENSAGRRAWLGRWSACGLPVIRLDAEHAALLPSEAPSDRSPPAPWLAFVLALPEGLIASGRPGGRSITRIGVHVKRTCGLEHWSWYSRDHLGLYFELHDESVLGFLGERRLATFDLATQEMARAVGRLVAGTVLAVDQGTLVLVKKKPAPVKWRLSKGPRETEYLLRPPAA